MSVSSTLENSPENSAAWRDFVAASPHGDVLQTLEWGPVKRPEYTPIPVSIATENGLAATCLILKKRLPAGRCYFYLSRGPILNWSDDKIVRAMFDKLRQLAKKHRAIFIRTDPCVLDETPGVKALLKEIGAVPSPDSGSIFGGLQPRCNMKLDISAPVEEFFEKKFESKWRYNTRLAVKKGVSVKADCTREDLKIFHDIYRVTGERNEFKGYSLAYFEKMWDALEPAGILKLFITYHEEQPLSGAIAFKLPPQAWYMFGASSNEKRNLMPNHLMQWTMMQWAKENACTSYDFRGVPDPSASDIPAHEEGLVKFKTGFGAEMTRYIGEYDLPLDKLSYWAWTSARPKAVTLLKKLKK
ncbi:Lipid II:glycine glycyltransferase (Peptidoglycan interpeptide bridge formation enzyme) [Abditibacterium utsteinense]|uniref:Lipid II:glycine glycyltransferase (Peptidoglycan interpeptide bridge formation enzyme) n=1 Tax=Abditibacterium utsteinense TaxID=1960156 RepID=A0A2S8SVI7_9BACT|nr:peptidoglycan bridge formation glycyltransferase FemA/FemB family protein [Abditibacterium utsteinense]PQV64794.1 Lipid II:glycine glycyltransferase (Peptidoglycan interpeptide bridge formation enzyme) [Abditibacterium utsteinense]